MCQYNKRCPYIVESKRIWEALEVVSLNKVPHLAYEDIIITQGQIRDINIKELAVFLLHGQAFCYTDKSR